jgi:DNA polymerase elongation subunit (family B)
MEKPWWKNQKVLLFDIETKPVKFWGWGVGKQYVTHDRIVNGERFDIICIAYKWIGEKETHCLDWGANQNSAKMIEQFSKQVEQADLVIGHNGDRFDIKHVNTQRLMHGQKPIKWPTSEDTLKQLRANFAFACYKLDYITKTLFGEGKSPMAMDDWINIVEKKCKKSLHKMIEYNKRDVVLLERTFIKLAPYIKPKINKSHGTIACPRCNSFDIIKYGHRYTMTGKKQVYQCRSCYSIHSRRVNNA